MTLATAVLHLIAAHLGTLHPYETVLVLLLAFGPFVVIVLLVLRERRHHAALDAEAADRRADDEVSG